MAIILWQINFWLKMHSTQCTKSFQVSFVVLSVFMGTLLVHTGRVSYEAENTI